MGYAVRGLGQRMEGKRAKSLSPLVRMVALCAVAIAAGCASVVRLPACRGRDAGGTAFTTMTDQHGDVVGTFSPTSTAEGLAGYSSYSPYGAETATNFGENLGYQGDCTDPVTGLVYMKRPLVQPSDRFVCLQRHGGRHPGPFHG